MISCRIAIIVALCNASVALGQSTKPTDPARTGTFETTFTERSPQSAPAALAKRLGLAKPEADYDLSTFEFIVHVPENYDPAKPLGVMYLQLHRDTHEPPHPCLPFFDERGMIVVVTTLKNQPEAARCGQMLDVLYNLRKTYTLDESRTYLFAMWIVDQEFSNQRIALSCGDQFSGMYLGEAQFYKEIPYKKGYANWPAKIVPPPASYLATAKLRGIILAHRIAGDAYSPFVQKGFEQEGFKFVITMDEGPEDMHYPNCSPDFLRKCFDFFDASTAKAAAIASQPPPKEAAPAATRPSTSKPAAPAQPAISEPARILKLAESYIAAGSYTQARTRLKTIIEKYPTSPEATKAKALLKEIESK